MQVPRTAIRRPRRGAWTAAIAAVASLLLAACAGTSGHQVDVRAEDEGADASTTSTTAAPDCAQMLPVEARAAQLILAMVTSPELAQPALSAGTLGGFGLKGNQTKDVGDKIAAAVEGAPLPPLVGADEEGGTVQRLRLALGQIPAAATVAKGTPEEAAQQATEHATGMRQLGFNMNFAPVADVGSGSGLGTRSYGSDPRTVSTFVEAVWPAMQGAGVMPVVKHWPGIGGGKVDPHQRLGTLAPIDELRAEDLIPFETAIKAGVPAVMVAHAEVPGLTQDGEPASLSHAAITGELRGNEGFDGLVITDSLGMGAIVADHTQAEAAELAILAGADVAMVSGADVVPEVHARLVDAISSGRIPPDQVLASVRRVLGAKGVEGQCMDAVARYSAIAREAATTTAATGGGSASSVTSTTTKGSGSTGSGAGSGTSSTVKGTGGSSTSTTAKGSAGGTGTGTGAGRTSTTIDSGING
jgi:beta-N-acetylhexosaminidase